MDKALSSGFLRGRRFGWVSFLWYKSVSKSVQIISADPSGRVLTLNLNIEHRSMLIFNVYFPCFDNSVICKAGYVCIGFIENLLDNKYYSDIVILGDPNFPCSENNGFVQFSELLQSYKLSRCDDLIAFSIKYTYVNTVLGHASCI